MTELVPEVHLDLRCANCPVRHHAICSALDTPHIHELTDIMTHRHFCAGDEVLHQDETSQLFAIIVRGIVKLTRMLPDGREQIVGLLSGSDILGDIETAVSHDSAQCVTDVEVCCFRRKQFEAVLEKHPELAHHLLKKASANLDEARDWMMVLGRLGAMEKVARFILWQCNKDHPGCIHQTSQQAKQVVHMPLKREEIAGFLGMTIETVSRNMSKLRADGIIEMPNAKDIRITDIDRLRDIAVIYEGN
ncbi:MAG: Crp/Fnr family transcriptional regulator [Anderseniella sp.]|nr:Crp/Fnr family transcriptional regulator [Anderseniella sp.]